MNLRHTFIELNAYKIVKPASVAPITPPQISNADIYPLKMLEYPVEHRSSCITTYRQLNIPIPPPMTNSKIQYCLLVKHTFIPTNNKVQ